MTYSLKIRLFALALGLALGLAGCGHSEDDTSLPWTQPASWEGQAPMMGGVPM